LFENPTFDVPNKSAYLVRTVLLASFYAPAQPFALIYTIIGLTMYYWSEKVTYWISYLEI